MSDREFGRQNVIYVGSMGTVMLNPFMFVARLFFLLLPTKNFKTATSSSSDLKKSEGIIIYLFTRGNQQVTITRTKHFFL